MANTYYIGQTFTGEYDTGAAEWCNANNAMIIEIGKFGDTRMFEIVAIPEPTPEEQKQARIDELKAQLATTDYKIIKCSEYQLAGVPLPYDIATLHAERQALRDEINQLEG